MTTHNYQIAWTAQASQKKRTGSAAILAFSFAIIMVFLILAAQFETWTLPLAVIMAVPFALAGALLAILIRGMPDDIYFQVGLITLIGLAAKNAILIVVFGGMILATFVATIFISLLLTWLTGKPARKSGGNVQQEIA